MHITDKYGVQHTVGITDKATVDDIVVCKITKYGNSMTIHNFSLPVQLQSRGIGSGLLMQIERNAHQRGVEQLMVHITDKHCPIHKAFWSKHGYHHNGTIWHKSLKH